MKPQPTRGPVTINRHGDITRKNRERDTVLLSGVALPGGNHPDSEEAHANALLLCASINSATACADLGYDPIKCVEMLPEMVKAISAIIAQRLGSQKAAEAWAERYNDHPCVDKALLAAVDLLSRAKLQPSDTGKE